MGNFVRFTLLRFALFVIPLLVLLLFKTPPLVAVLVAAVVSMVTSLVLLRGPREQLARELEAKVSQRQQARGARLAAERTDEEVEDAQLGEDALGEDARGYGDPPPR